MLGDRIKYLRNLSGLTQEELCKHVDIAQSTLAMLESNKRKSAGKKTLLKLSEFFGVSINYFLIEEFWNIHEREEIKKKAREIIEGEYPIDEKISAAINMYKAYYYRSLEASDFNNKHAKLNDFIAMMLNQKNTKGYLPSDVYEELVKIYGVKEGIKNGSSYFSCNNIGTSINVPTAKVYSDDERKLIDNYNKLNNLGKKKLLEYSNDLTETPKYKKEENNKVVELPTKKKFIWEEPGKEHLMPIASHDRNGEFTEEDYKHDEDLMKDDDFWK
ncbi:MAG: helix-turn-helix domain-containing protein [Clostridium paraputrificum]|uniref:helix-turn-helix domain-containing protein n=1 Tax=Clostridium paraputrificum TaxID=29363 RepID=UPI00189F5F3C|nr:helix-turn-helix transcriptional regulator [Clostridium paraputrificum]